MKWQPDFCPPPGRCHIELGPGTSLIRFLRLCQHHQRMMASGMTEAQVFDVVCQSSRVKEAARWAAKVQLGLDKEHPGLSWTVDASGNFTIQSGVTGATRAALRTVVEAEVSKVRRPNGTSTVSVA